MKFWWEFKYFHSRKCTWKCRLRNGIYFVSDAICVKNGGCVLFISMFAFKDSFSRMKAEQTLNLAWQVYVILNPFRRNNSILIYFNNSVFCLLIKKRKRKIHRTDIELLNYSCNELFSYACAIQLNPVTRRRGNPGPYQRSPSFSGVVNVTACYWIGVR